MSYSDFTLSEVKRRFNLTIVEDHRLFPQPPTLVASPRLTELLAVYLPLATSINTEKARSEYIIAPILAELKLLFKDRLSLFSGIDFNIEPAQGLNGRCDYIFSRSPEQLELIAPVVMIVEAKNENLIAGIPQCIAEMVAAQKFNQKNQNAIEVIDGCVTTGSLWRFMNLQGQVAYVDPIEFAVRELETILGILAAMTVNKIA
jgi:hypothetical protein